MRPATGRRVTRLSPLVSLLLPLLLLTIAAPWRADAKTDESVRRLEAYQSFFEFPRNASWSNAAPQVKEVRIRSSADGSRQPALHYDSGSKRDKPLLVVLHSWSDDYRQRYSIPFALWAVRNDWAFIHPDFRGRNDGPRATGSELAVQDILDAVDYAKRRGRIDASRVYLVGFSGGGMATLLMVGRRPELWNAAVAFVPIFDLREWYDYIELRPEKHYAAHIAASCGGRPTPGSASARECAVRSPRTYLERARERTPRLLIAHGIEDDVVPPSNSLRAYNVLAAPEDRIADEDVSIIDSTHALPSGLLGDYSTSRFARTYEEAGKPLAFERTSGNVTIQLFEGGHDVIFHAAVAWLESQGG